MPRVIVGRLLVGIGVCVATVMAQEAPVSLQLGKPVERELVGGQTHTYALTLAANQIARVIAEQKGVDLVLSVVAPDGTRLFDIDSPNGTAGDEPATIAARRGGTYRVEVRSLDPSAASGRYAIRLDAFPTEGEYTTERLAGLGRSWGAAKFFHPSLAYSVIDWDAALVKAVPLVKAARTPGEYRDAINVMLQALNDPATRAELPTIETTRPAPAVAAAQQPTYFRAIDGFVVVSATDWSKAMMGQDSEWPARQTSMREAIAQNKGVVLDCRYGGLSPTTLPSYYLSTYLASAVPSLVQGSMVLGTERYRLHNGYPTQRGGSSGGYWSGFLVKTPDAMAGVAKEKKPLAVVIDEKTPDLLPLLSGLQAVGTKIVSVGRQPGNAGGQIHQMLLPDGVRLSLRVAEFVHPGGGSEFHPDVQLTPDAGAGNGAIAAAIAALNAPSPATAPAEPKAAAVTVQGQADRPYPQMSFPPEEYRLLALFRYWNVINYFYPYKDLTDTPWSAVLGDFIPRMLENKSAIDYEMTVAEMVARMQDSHGGASGLRNLNARLGAFSPAVRLGSAGGKLAVVEVMDAAARAAGITLGDVIVAVDGEPVAQWLAARSRFRALSTPQAAYAFIYPSALSGAQNSKVTVRVEGADGQGRDVELVRTLPVGAVSWMAPRKLPVYHIMANGYGYIDLERLPLADAQKALDAVLKAPAVIFDMRGYPQGTAWAIAPRLGAKQNVTGALFRRPLQVATDLDSEDLGGGAPDYAFEQKLPPARGAIYKGKVVMLINEFAISQSEHTCLFFEAATDVTFIGGPTNGANGDVTSMVLPGGIYVSFTGHDVRHADGRQLQRVGIQPHVKVEPTAKGIGEGRDEVLEAAVRFLDQTLTAKEPVKR
jgi:C-terminal processing protease CtpA/Prc